MRKLSLNIIAFLSVVAITSVASAQPGSFIDLGIIGTEGSYVFNTDNSLNILPTAGNCDTELGLWDATGLLIAEDDDGSALNFWSEITASLTQGMYFLGIGEFNSDFEDGFINIGTSWEPGETSDVDLNITGGIYPTKTLVGEFDGASDQLDQETAFFKVTVVPEPGSFLLFSVGMCLLARRRR